jgi:hypothetical protein
MISPSLSNGLHYEHTAGRNWVYMALRIGREMIPLGWRSSSHTYKRCAEVQASL